MKKIKDRLDIDEDYLMLERRWRENLEDGNLGVQYSTAVYLSDETCTFKKFSCTFPGTARGIL